MTATDQDLPVLRSLGARLKYLRERAKMRQADVAAAVSMSQGNYSNLERDAYPGGTTYIPALARVFGCDVQWLDGSQNAKPITQAAKTAHYLDSTQIVRTIPLIEWYEYSNFLHSGISERVVQVVGKFSNKAFALVHRGHSMMGPRKPVIPDGAVLIVDPQIPPAVNRCVVVEVHGDACVGTYAEYAGKRLLIPSNSQFPTIDITTDTIIGEVVAVQTDPHA